MSTPNQHPVTFGVIVGNRGFFPDHLAKSGREEMIAVLSKAGHRVIALGPEDSKHGIRPAPETRRETPVARLARGESSTRGNN